MSRRLVSVTLAALLLVSCGHPFVPIENPTERGDYAVLAWNDLGMHCLNPTYDTAVILPPYNNLVAQVVKRGDPPELITSGITVEYKIDYNTSSSDKKSFGQFWTNAVALFGDVFGITTLAPDTGLTGNGLTGTMEAATTGDYYTATGIPVVPYDDALTWNPYQVAVVTVKKDGVKIAETNCTIPTSDEINCAKCHPGSDPFVDILAKHDAEHETNLQGSTPVLCASCHDSPALNTDGPQIYLSKAIHGFHAQETNAACYDCHPGAETKCSRSTRHTAADGNCTDCHGTLSQVASSITGASGGESDRETGSARAITDTGTRTPWANEPSCVTCHPGVADVDTGTTLYRNAPGHGDLRCAACHGSPHAMIPTDDRGTFTNWDNYRSVQYQGYRDVVKSIGSCGVCHLSSQGPPRLDGLFTDVHGGSTPRQTNGCHTCHTSLTAETAAWPHAHQWRNSN